MFDGGSVVSADYSIAGGNVNVTDEDGDTPLYTVESIETARFLVDNGADPTCRNNEGLTVCQALAIHISFLRLC
jgi:ankyrin repeat protein